MDALHSRIDSIVLPTKASLRAKLHRDGWVLPKQTTSFAPEGTWTNVDLDVTPLERRIWTPLSFLGYWISDVLSAQSWQIGASVLAIGLTYREAVYCIILGSTVMAGAIAFNGAPGAYLRVPFPVWSRSAFGYHGARLPVICRMVTALFWHSIQTYTGSLAMTVMLTAIWPSYACVPNHLPKSAGITTSGMLSHVLFWSLQLPFLLIRPHKLKWFFVFKAFITITAAVGTAIAVCKMAGGSGDIWDQRPQVQGRDRAWLVVSTLTAQTGSWSTVGTNISDFTRYAKKPRTIYYQVFLFPVICFTIAFLGVISASASKHLYGEYIWDPLTLASKWTSPAGRLGAFYCGLAWCIAQIGVNVSANVISVSNDLASLFPKYINLRRAALLATLVAGWIMVPWKIITGASSLINFMASLGIFLAPIICISIADYWIVKKCRVDVADLYRPAGRYHYIAGVNWRAMLAMICSIGPAMPGLAQNISPSLNIGGALYVADLVWYYGFLSAFVVYVTVSKIWPAEDTLVDKFLLSEDADLDVQVVNELPVKLEKV
ncbi:uridine permease-like protein Fui1, partial [Aureobasidium melanogenum]